MATQVNKNQLTDYWQDAATQTLPDFSQLISTGFAQDGNPVAGQKATLPGAAWFNIMAAVRVSVILAAGKTPSNPPDPMQFLEALQSLGWMTSKSVKTEVLADKSVTNAKLADQAVTIAKIANALLATQSQAEAGTSSDVLMTPLRVKQAIEKALEEDLPKASETQLGGVKITGDDGITINEAGEIAVDFSEMPTDKFEEMLKSIRVPIWLSASTNFFVNGQTGNDSNDGLSAGKAFKTIQACYNNIADNYNLSSYIARIRIADGTYQEELNLGSYNSTTGGIIIIGNESDKSKVIIETRESTTNALITTRHVNGKSINIQFVTLNLYSEGIDPGTRTDLDIVNAMSGITNLQDVTLNFHASDNDVVSYSFLYIGSSAEVSLIPGNIDFNMINEGGDSWTGNREFAYVAGRLTLGNADASSPSLNTITVSGDYSRFVDVNSGQIYRNQSRPARFATSGTVTGIRYYVRNNGGIATNGGGPEFFPGDTEGVLQASTYSWYS